MERIRGTMFPQAASRSSTMERVNSASQSALSAVMLTSAICSIGSSLRVDEVLNDLAGLVVTACHSAPACDNDAVVAHAHPPSPRVGAVRMESEVHRAL